MSETSDSQQSLPPYQSPEKSVPNSCVTSTKKQGHRPKGSLNVQYFFVKAMIMRLLLEVKEVKIKLKIFFTLLFFL